MNIVKFVALAAVLSSPISAGTIEAPTNRLIIIRGDTVAVHFEVEIADSHAERSRGLMGRGKLDSRTGMWFDCQRQWTDIDVDEGHADTARFALRGRRGRGVILAKPRETHVTRQHWRVHAGTFCARIERG